MKILAFADLHGDFRTLKTLTKKAKQADIIIVPGDISVFGRDLDYLLFKLNNIGKKVLIIHGNHETETELKSAARTFERIHFIHKKIYKHHDTLFVGWGGGGFSKTDKRFESWVKTIEKKLKGKKFVFITHGPPYDTKCDYIAKEHVGNKSYTNFIKKNKPKLAICGHIHECERKKQKLGDTLIVNPGFDGMFLEV